MSNNNLNEQQRGDSRSSSSSTSNSSSSDPLGGAIIEPACVEYILVQSVDTQHIPETLVIHDFFDGDRIVELKLHGSVVKTGKWIPSDKAISDAIDKHATIKKKHPDRHEMWSIHFSDCEKIVWDGEFNEAGGVSVKYDTETSNLIVGDVKVYVMGSCSGPVREEGLVEADME